MLGLVLVVLGMILLAAPIVPGTLIVYAGILLIAWADEFSRIGVPALFILAVIAFAGTIVDNIAGIWGARLGGASGWGLAGAALGALAGLPFGLPGIMLGPALGALTFEYLKNPELARAARAGAGSVAGFFLGILFKYVFGALLIGAAAFAYVF